ncbi:hypothetical protein KCU79_g16952, partial [Aureobasidium melanogenum]
MLAQPIRPSQEASRPTISPPKTPKKGKLLGALRPKLTRLFSGKSMEKLTPAVADPSRSKSESGPSGGANGDPLEPIRSKSLANDDLTHVLTRNATLDSMISRHDQYPGLDRVPTLELRKK